MAVEIKSLSSVADADQYFENRLHTQAWDALNPDQKQQALNDATRIIDIFNYVGDKTDDSQEHEWPRTNIINVSDSETPDDILKAQYEIALALAKGIDPEREFRNLFVTSRGYSSARITYDPRHTPEHLTVGVPSAIAWAYLCAYIDRSAQGGIKLHRVD